MSSLSARFVCGFVLILCVTAWVYAQEESRPHNGLRTRAGQHYGKPHYNREPPPEDWGVHASEDQEAPEEVGQGPVLLGVGALAFGLSVIVLGALLRAKDRIDTSAFFKLAGLALVLAVGLSLIVVGYSQYQIAPMMGLLGTVAGYLLGKGEGARRDTARLARPHSGHLPNGQPAGSPTGPGGQQPTAVGG
jgi:hypothetical protein